MPRLKRMLFPSFARLVENEAIAKTKLCVCVCIIEFFIATLKIFFSNPREITIEL